MTVPNDPIRYVSLCVYGPCMERRSNAIAAVSSIWTASPATEAKMARNLDSAIFVRVLGVNDSGRF